MNEIKQIIYNPLALCGCILLFFFGMVAIFAPYIAPPHSHNSYMIPHKGFSSTPKPPNMNHYFGTSSGQYDIFYGVVWGTRTAFKIGLYVVAVASLIGIAIGTIAGYFGGIIDEIIMRFVDIIWTIPTLVLAMAIVVAFGRGLENVMLALALISWRWYVRVMRSEILSLREQDFIHAAKMMGVSHIRIMIRHILPNAIYPIFILASMDMGTMVVTASFMSFVGLGAPKGYADWGQMVALSRNYIIGPPDDPFRYWYTVFFPGGCIILFVLSWNIIGDALRDIYDPKMQTRPSRSGKKLS